MQRRQLLAAIPVAALGIGAAWWSTRDTSPTDEAAGADSTPITPITPAEAAEGDAIDTSGILEMTLGDTNAPVEVIEYASFTCPHCARFHETVFGELKKNYIDTGKVHFIYREVYFDKFGLWAGMVARCGGPMRYFGIADLIYTRQREWLAGGEPAQAIANLRKIGKLAGMGDEALDACLSDEDKARALVTLYQRNADADNIHSTPSFVIDGENYSNMSYDEFAAVLDAKLGG